MLNKYKVNKIVTVIFLICVQICLTSCRPEFKEPIPRSSDGKIDAQLLGNWTRMTEEGGKQQLSIFPRSSNWLDIFYIYDINSPSTLDGANMMILEGYNTEIQGQKFLCLRFRDKDVNCWKEAGDFVFFDKDTGKYSYFITLYQTNNNTLSVHQFSIEKVEELINNGTLKGKIFEGERPEDKPERVFVKSSSEDLVKIISEKGVQIFLKENKDNPMLFIKNEK